MLNLAILRFSLRQQLGRHRLFALFFLAVLATLPSLLAALIIRLIPLTEHAAMSESNRLALSLNFFENFMLAWIIPALVLLGGAMTLREEIRNQTIEYLYLKPISRITFVLSKFVGGMIVPTGLALWGIGLLTAFLGDGRVGVFLVSGASTVWAYGALFFALSLWHNRTVLWAFGYLVLWESFLFGLSQPASQLSIKRYALGLTHALLNRTSEPSVETSLTVLGIVILCALAFSVWRMRTMEFPGSTE